MAISPPVQSATVDAISTSTTSANLIVRPAYHARLIFNNSAAILYILYGTGTASSSNFSVAIAAQGYYEVPQPLYGGQITGVLASGTGTAQVTTY
jgi:hypothetical protein